MKTKSFIQCIFCVLAGLAVLMTTVSCGDDDKDKDATPDNSSGNKLVKKIESMYGSIQFYYDAEGNLRRMLVDGANGGDLNDYTYSKVGNRLVVTNNWIVRGIKDYPGETTYTCTLDGNGNIVSAYSSIGYTYRCSYDKEGYLKSYEEDENDNGSTFINYIWKGGNLSQYAETEEKYKSSYSCTCVYTDKENKMNIDLGDLTEIYGYWELSYGGSTGVEDYSGGNFGPMSAGYLGRKNEYLIERAIYKSAYDVSNCEFSYEFDEEGYVTKFMYAEGDESDVYNVSYY